MAAVMNIVDRSSSTSDCNISSTLIFFQAIMIIACNKTVQDISVLTQAN